MLLVTRKDFIHIAFCSNSCLRFSFMNINENNFPLYSGQTISPCKYGQCLYPVRSTVCTYKYIHIQKMDTICMQNVGS